MFFSVINKNLHWEFINKNLVTFKLLKDEMKLGVKNFRELCKKPKYRGTNIYIYIYILYNIYIYISECKNWGYVEQVQGVKWYVSY